MNVLSLFDGMSCGRLALQRADIPIDYYYASEIEAPSIKVANRNFPDTVQLGDVTKWRDWEIKSPELLLAGSPCQSISGLGKMEGLAGKSGLFYDFLNIKNHYKPKYFLLENVKGKKVAIEEITETLGIEPIQIDSSLVSGQNRKRLYWTNIPGIVQPNDKGILLKDILEQGIPESSLITPKRLRWITESESGLRSLNKRYSSLDPIKAQCLTARSDPSWNSNYVTRDGVITRLTPREYERLQTVPDNYTDCVSDKHRYAMLGNGWTVDVIAHILSFIKSANGEVIKPHDTSLSSLLV